MRAERPGLRRASGLRPGRILRFSDCDGWDGARLFARRGSLGSGPVDTGPDLFFPPPPPAFPARFFQVIPFLFASSFRSYSAAQPEFERIRLAQTIRLGLDSAMIFLPVLFCPWAREAPCSSAVSAF